MTKPVSQMVLYRDSRTDPMRLFGPFVSKSIAEFFKAQLPDPLPGGAVKIVPTQPFTQQEGHIVRKKLLDERT